MEAQQDRDLHFTIWTTNPVEIWKRQNRWEDKKSRRRHEQEDAYNIKVAVSI